MKKLITLFLIISTLFSALSLTACDVDENSEESGKNTVTVTFSVESEVASIPSQTIEKGTRATKPDDPQKSNFSFLGWYLGDVPFDFSTSITEDITLVAVWEENAGNLPSDDENESEEKDWWENICYDSTTLTFKMTKNSNLNELTSGCERYMEGAGIYGEDIDQMISDRNSDALYCTNIAQINYTYYTDDNKYNFASTYNVMHDEIYNPDKESADMYCSFMTDMVIASLHGCFANLNSKSNGANYFNFKDPGYMADFMRSITLNKNKMYVVASDYFIDIPRSFYVIPVNVDLYKEIASTALCQDYDNSDTIDVNDLFAQVKAGEWTYQKLMDYSSAIYAAKNSDTATEELSDVLGFALGHDILSAQGLVYSSSVKIISGETGNNGLDCVYPEEKQALYDLATAIQTLVETNGVMCVKASDATSVGATGLNAPLKAIKQQFTNNKMLFGGIVTLGSLENQEYKDMITSESSSGFGILPVPVYKAGDNYSTAMHNTAKAGAICRFTQKFTECTAFLHYQSSKSTEILYEYFDKSFTRSTSESLKGNTEMLGYIRSNVSTGFDKHIEDAIGFLYESQGNSVLTSANRWHAIICSTYYCNSGIRMEYTRLVNYKNTYLNNLIALYLQHQD